jgi:hypothetical protein
MRAAQGHSRATNLKPSYTLRPHTATKLEA